MKSFRQGRVCALLASVILVGVFVAPSAEAAAWRVDPVKSVLGFSGVQTGTRFQGRFKHFTAAINFDPDHLDTSHISVVVDLASASTGDSQRDGALPGKDWFDVAHFPQAKFESSAIRRTGANAFEATGNLTLRGVAKPVILPFTLQITGTGAHAQGRAQLMRSAFGVGQGTWASGEWVALNVDVNFDIAATRAPAGKPPGLF